MAMIKNKYIFYWSSKVFGESCLELAILRRQPNGKKQIYLTARPENDPYFPSMMHMPGVRKFPGDDDEKQLKKVTSETPVKIDLSNIMYLASTTVTTKRSTEFADLRYVVVPYYFDEPDFYFLDDLPKNTIDHHRMFIDNYFRKVEWL